MIKEEKKEERIILNEDIPALRDFGRMVRTAWGEYMPSYATEEEDEFKIYASSFAAEGKELIAIVYIKRPNPLSKKGYTILRRFITKDREETSKNDRKKI